MRKKDREISDEAEIKEILEKGQICHLALCDGDQPYIIPMNYGIEWVKPLKIYFHCGTEGRKLDIINKNNKACFELDVDNEFIMGKLACSCSFNYRSIIAFGTIEIITDREEVIKGLDIIMKQYTGKSEYEYNETALKLTTVLEMTISELTGKRKMVKGKSQ
jgi:uncharacterized protein